MLPTLLFWLFMLACIFLSLWIRSRKLRRYWRYTAGEAGEQMFSPIAQALGNLLSAAGGIYLSGQLLVEFLKLPEIPQVVWQGTSVDMLALLSLWAAILQPFFMWLAGLFRRKP